MQLTTTLAIAEHDHLLSSESRLTHPVCGFENRFQLIFQS
jgi:hypothetical protein